MVDLLSVWKIALQVRIGQSSRRSERGVKERHFVDRVPPPARLVAPG
jgi:hypothetical protein